MGSRTSSYPSIVEVVVVSIVVGVGPLSISSIRTVLSYVANVEISKYYPLEILSIFFWFISPTC